MDKIIGITIISLIILSVCMPIVEGEIVGHEDFPYALMPMAPPVYTTDIGTFRFVDYEMSNVCYLYISARGRSISCLPLEQ